MSTSAAALAVRKLSLDPDGVEKWDAEDRARIRGASPVKKKGSTEGSTDEPEISDKESIKKWRAWLATEAVAYAHTVHPRKQGEGGVPTKLPLCCSHAELMGATNVGVRLYFDLLRLFIGFGVLGLICHVPSFIASAVYVDHGAYAASTGFVASFPAVLNLFSLGARARELDGGYQAVSGCPPSEVGWSTCELLNTFTALLDVFYTIFFFVCLLRFQRYARGLDEVDRGENVMIAEYTIELYGLKGAADVTPGQMKAHVEKALIANAKAKLVAKREQHRHAMWQAFLDENCHEVVDVVMIADDRKVLKGLVKMEAAESKVPKLESKLKFMTAMGKGPGSIKSMEKKIESAKVKRDKRRVTLSKRTEKPFGPVGAIITFNKEQAVEPAMELFSTGMWLPCCPPAKAAYAKMDTGDGKTRRLKAFEPAGRPQGLIYENMHARFSWSTAARRQIANLLLAAIILIGMIVTIAGVFFKDSADIFARIVVQVVSAAGTADAGSGAVEIFANVTNSSTAGTGAQCTADDLALVSAEASDMDFDRVQFLVTNVTALLAKDASTLTVDETVTLKGLTDLLVASLKCFAAPAFGVIISIVTVVLNVVIGICVKMLQDFGKYSSISEMHMSEVIKLAFTTFINTAAIQILVNLATGPSMSSIPGMEESNWICFGNTTADANDPTSELTSSVKCLFGPNGILMRGSHFDPSPRFYNDIGAGLMQTMIIQLIVRIITSFIPAIVFSLKKCLTLGGVKSVKEAEAIVTGPDLALPGRIGKLYAFIAICLLFSTGMPLMFALIAIMALFCYYIDKWSVLSVCQTPVPYSFKIISSTIWWLKYILVAKLVFAWWAFGSLPGIPLNAAMGAALSAAASTGSVDTTSAAAGGDALLTALGDSYLSQRLATVGSLLLLLGTIVAIILVSAQAVLGRLPSFVFALCEFPMFGCHKEAPAAEYNPPFKSCIGGYADVPGVKVLKPGVMILSSEVTPEKTKWYQCRVRGLHSLMLALCGLEVRRSRVSQEEYDKLPNKQATISGKANMTYAPFFMPRYEKAFRFAKGDGVTQVTVEKPAEKAAPQQPVAEKAETQPVAEKAEGDKDEVVVQIL